MSYWRLFTRVLAALALFVALLFAPRTAVAEPGDGVTISVLTFGPGDHPFFKFGHNAILVHDGSLPEPDSDLVYNYGTFSFASRWLLVDFFKGRLRYWLSVDTLDATLDDYAAENRSVDAEELALTREQSRSVADFLAWNALPEHRLYTYDYYRDNCSTRIRDVVDRVTSGSLPNASRAPAEYTWREHTLRLTADDFLVYLGLDAAMGDVIDRPITQWEEMFLPAKLAQSLRRATIPGPNGETSLVRTESHLVASRGRATPRSAPPQWTFRFFCAGCAAGLFLAFLGRFASRFSVARLALGVLFSLSGLILGSFGTLFASFWAFTDHRVAYHNENILQLAPFVLLLVSFGVGVARHRETARLRAFYTCAAAAACSLVGIGLKVLPWFDQHNGQILAFMAPFWAGGAAAMLPAWVASTARRSSAHRQEPLHQTLADPTGK